MLNVDAPLWMCPRCGHRFVSRNLSHSCGRYGLDDHFARSLPAVRAMFERIRSAAESLGPVTVYAQKTRIVFMVRVRFAGVMTRRRWLIAHLWLSRRAAHPCLDHIDDYGRDCLVHFFRFERPEQVDDDFALLLRDAYTIGRQDHLKPR